VQANDEALEPQVAPRAKSACGTRRGTASCSSLQCAFCLSSRRRRARIVNRTAASYFGEALPAGKLPPCSISQARAHMVPFPAQHTVVQGRRGAPLGEVAASQCLRHCKMSRVKCPSICLTFCPSVRPSVRQSVSLPVWPLYDGHRSHKQVNQSNQSGELTLHALSKHRRPIEQQRVEVVDGTLALGALHPGNPARQTDSFLGTRRPAPGKPCETDRLLPWHSAPCTRDTLRDRQTPSLALCALHPGYPARQTDSFLGTRRPAPGIPCETDRQSPSSRFHCDASGAAARSIKPWLLPPTATETHRIHCVLFGMQNRGSWSPVGQPHTGEPERLRQ
jgi:hypothetical protein